MADKDALLAHLAGGLTTVARCWSVRRQDGTIMGFTDHDLPLSYDGLTFAASSGLTARALQQGTGLAVDNSEAIGALSHDMIREEDIRTGRYDNADVTAWLVNWANVDERMVQFRGTIGEIQRRDGQFTAELRGLTEALNQTYGRVYQKPCSAVLGDKACQVNLNSPLYRGTYQIAGIEDNRVLDLGPMSEFRQDWFTRGTLRPTTGAASGLLAVIKEDRGNGTGRRLHLWSDIRTELEVGDLVEVTAGCDKRDETCRKKFENFLNFRGFPDIPGDDWLISYPTWAGQNDGGSLT